MVLEYQKIFLANLKYIFFKKYEFLEFKFHSKLEFHKFEF